MGKFTSALTSEWQKSGGITTNPFTRNGGVRDDIVGDAGGFTVTHKDRTTADYRYPKQGAPYPWMLTRLTDTHNNAISVTYDVNGRVSTITDAAGRTLTLNYSGDFTLQSVVLNAGGILRQWDFTTDVNSNLTRIQFPTVTGPNGTSRPEIDPP